MKKLSSTILFFLLFVTIAYPQEMTLKEQALEEFKKEHYNKAIDLLKKALSESPNDAEIYYYLGWFNHYRAYDSRPLKGYDNSYSEQIFKYLDKALELDLIMAMQNIFTVLNAVAMLLLRCKTMMLINLTIFTNGLMTKVHTQTG